MAFKENFKLEETYYKNLKTLIVPLNDIRRKTKDRDTKEVLDVVVQCVGAILQILRHLSEEWGVLLSFIQKNADAIKEAIEKSDAYHDELNEKIDEVNNYLLALIRELEAKVDALEMCKCKTYYLSVGEYERSIIVDIDDNRITDTVLKNVLADGGIVYLVDRYYGYVYYLENRGTEVYGVETEPTWVRWVYPVTSGSVTNAIEIQWLTWVPEENYLRFDQTLIPTLNSNT